ncbi:MAG: hypothetical protein QXS20_06170 [Candidatus Thorarchaeota archaeon]
MSVLLSRTARERVLSIISPTDEEVNEQRSVIAELTEALVCYGYDARPRHTRISAEGSTGAKQTQLRGQGDIDLFVGFDFEDFTDVLALKARERKRYLSRVFTGVVDSWFLPAVSRLPVSNLVKAYSEHPYLSLRMNGIDVDIVAYIDMTEEQIRRYGPLTPVDRTPHHTRFVASSLDTRLREDVRLLKSFVRAGHAYGDRCPIGQFGFTGYTLEILVVACGGIEPALSRLLVLEQEPLDPRGRDPETLRGIPGLEKDHIIVVDPTDTDRNAASSISARSFKWIAHRTRTLQRLSGLGKEQEMIEMFIEKPIPSDPLPGWATQHAFAFEFLLDPTIHYTILRDKLYHKARHIQAMLSSEDTGEVRFGQVLVEALFDDNRCALGFLVERPQIGPTYSQRGPPVSMPEAVARFKKEHPEAYERDGRLWLDRPRKYTDARDMLRELVGRNGIGGVSSAPDTTVMSAQVLNVLFRYVMQIEEFPLARDRRFREHINENGWW